MPELRSAAAVRSDCFLLWSDLQATHCCTLLCHSQQCSGVFESSATRSRHVVTTILAVDVHSLTDSPCDRMKEEQRFDDALQEIDDQIVAANMSQLVTQDRGKLIRIEAT
jgi:hypothetical protein